MDSAKLQARIAQVNGGACWHHVFDWGDVLALAQTLEATRKAKAENDERFQREAFDARQERNEALDMLGRRLAECDAYQARGIALEDEVRQAERERDEARAQRDRLQSAALDVLLAFDESTTHSHERKALDALRSAAELKGEPT